MSPRALYVFRLLARLAPHDPSPAPYHRASQITHTVAKLPCPTCWRGISVLFVIIPHHLSCISVLRAMKIPRAILASSRRAVYSGWLLYVSIIPARSHPHVHPLPISLIPGFSSCCLPSFHVTTCVNANHLSLSLLATGQGRHPCGDAY